MHWLPPTGCRMGSSFREDSDSAAVHVARTVCRRGERLIVMLNREVKEFDDLLVYFNRLSDFLFVLAWSLEVIWVVKNVTCEVIKDGSK